MLPPVESSPGVSGVAGVGADTCVLSAAGIAVDDNSVGSGPAVGITGSFAIPTGSVGWLTGVKLGSAGAEAGSAGIAVGAVSDIVETLIGSATGASVIAGGITGMSAAGAGLVGSVVAVEAILGAAGAGSDPTGA